MWDVSPPLICFHFCFSRDTPSWAVLHTRQHGAPARQTVTFTLSRNYFFTKPTYPSLAWTLPDPSYFILVQNRLKCGPFFDNYPMDHVFFFCSEFRLIMKLIRKMPVADSLFSKFDLQEEALPRPRYWNNGCEMSVDSTFASFAAMCTLHQERISMSYVLMRENAELVFHGNWSCFKAW